jgi:cytosine deaminase
MTYDILLKQGQVMLAPDRIEPGDVAIQAGRIAAIGSHLEVSAQCTLDVQGQLVSPPFVESHIHLDSALTVGQPRWNQSGTLFEGIEIWRERKQDLSLEDVKRRAIETLRQQAMQGVLYVRSHADVSEPSLTALQALLEVREQVKDWMTLQVVAFPQDGLYSSPSSSHPSPGELLEEALKQGADVVGGIPHYELTREDGVRSVEWGFELAERYDRLIDLHCDEIDDDQARFLEVLAAGAIRRDMGNRVTASHTTAFGSYNNAYAFKLLGFLQRSQLNLVANPLINITLQGRMDSYPKRRGVTRVKELWQAGLNVSLGHDCVQDPWYALGTGNMLDVAAMAVHVCQMTGKAELEACYDMVTWHGAKTLQVIGEYGLRPGAPANLIVLDAIDKYDAIRRRATVRSVIAQGKLLAQTQPARSQWYGAF